MTPRPRVVTPLLFAVGLCALVNCGYGPTCDGFDDLINNVNHMVCTRNEDCDTADCDITQSPFDDYTLSMTLLSCREPRPGVRVVARDGGGQVVLNTTVDESQSGIELSSEATLDITLDQMEDSIGIAAEVDVDLGFFSTTLTLISYTTLPLDRRSCPTQTSPTTTTTASSDSPTTENTSDLPTTPTTSESPTTEETTREPTVTPTSVITGVPSTQGVATPTPQPTPTPNTTCSVLAKLANDAEFFKCTADKTEPCDTVFCSQEFSGKQYSAVIVLLPCGTPAAVRIEMSEGEKVLVNETVDHSQEITIPELFRLVLTVKLDHFDDAIGLQADGMLASKKVAIIEYTVIPLDKSTCVTKDQSPDQSPEVPKTDSSSSAGVLETTPTTPYLLLSLITFLTAAIMMM